MFTETDYRIALAYAYSKLPSSFLVLAGIITNLDLAAQFDGTFDTDIRKKMIMLFINTRLAITARTVHQNVNITLRTVKALGIAPIKMNSVNIGVMFKDMHTLIIDVPDNLDEIARAWVSLNETILPMLVASAKDEKAKRACGVADPEVKSQDYFKLGLARVMGDARELEDIKYSDLARNALIAVTLASLPC